MNESSIDVIIIRGAPGVGKSTTAKKLAEYFPKGARVEVDTLRAMVISPDWKNQGEHINLLHVAAKVVSEFLGLGFRPVIVVDTFSGNKVEKFQHDLRHAVKEITTVIIGFHCSDEALRHRIEGRSHEEFKDFDISRKLNNATIKRQYPNEHQIDTSVIGPEETAHIVYESIMDRQSDHTISNLVPQ